MASAELRLMLILMFMLFVILAGWETSSASLQANRPLGVLISDSPFASVFFNFGKLTDYERFLRPGDFEASSSSDESYLIALYTFRLASRLRLKSLKIFFFPYSIVYSLSLRLSIRFILLGSIVMSTSRLYCLFFYSFSFFSFLVDGFDCCLVSFWDNSRG